MDPFRAEEIERYRRTPPGARLLEALDAMRDGFSLKWQNLKRQYPHASEQELDRMLLAWMSRD